MADTPAATPATGISICVFGRTGVGKSELCGTLTGATDYFRAAHTIHCETRTTMGHGGTFHEVETYLIDTPGLGDPELNDTENMVSTIRFLQANKTVQALVIALEFSNPRLTKMEFDLFNLFRSTFPGVFWHQHLAVVWTKCSLTLPNRESRMSELTREFRTQFKHTFPEIPSSQVDAIPHSFVDSIEARIPNTDSQRALSFLLAWAANLPPLYGRPVDADQLLSSPFSVPVEVLCETMTHHLDSTPAAELAVWLDTSLVINAAPAILRHPLPSDDEAHAIALLHRKLIIVHMLSLIAEKKLTFATVSETVGEAKELLRTANEQVRNESNSRELHREWDELRLQLDRFVGFSRQAGYPDLPLPRQVAASLTAEVAKRDEQYTQLSQQYTQLSQQCTQLSNQIQQLSNTLTAKINSTDRKITTEVEERARLGQRLSAEENKRQTLETKLRTEETNRTAENKSLSDRIGSLEWKQQNHEDILDTLTPSIVPVFGRGKLYQGGYTISASSTYGEAYHPSNAFNTNLHTLWNSKEGEASGSWLQVRLPSRRRFCFFHISSSVYPQWINEMPASFEIQASDDGTTWKTLQSNSGLSWTTAQTKTFQVSNDVAYLYYRIYIIRTNASYAQIGSWTMS